MIIGSRQRISNIITDPKIELGVSVIKMVNKSKTLGIVIDASTFLGTIKFKILSRKFQKE